MATAPADTAAFNKTQGSVKTGQPLFDVTLDGAASQEEEAQSFVESAPVTVVNPNGLHARPAAVLAQLASTYPFAVKIVKGENSADAKSTVGLMGLALALNDHVIIRAAGPQEEAQAIIAKIEAGFKDAFGEKGAAAQPIAMEVSPAVEEAPADFSKPVELKGLSACAGLAEGMAFLHQTEEISFDENAADPKAELLLLDTTFRAIISETQAKANAEKDGPAKEILTAHLSILQDPMLVQTAQEAVSRGKSAAWGVNEAIRSSIDVLKKTNNRFLMERIADLKDLRRAILLRLNGKPQSAPEIPEGCILLADVFVTAVFRISAFRRSPRH